MLECEGKIYTASFDGLEFIPTSASKGVGRDGPIHKFVDNDLTFPDDTGGEPEEYSISGVYGARKDGDTPWLDHAFLMAEAAKGQSPKRITHPLIGTNVQVFCKRLDISVDLTNAKGVVQYTFQLFKWDGLFYPEIGEIAENILLAGLSGLSEATQSLFNANINISGLPVYISNSITDHYSTIINKITDMYAVSVNWDSESADAYSYIKNAADSPNITDGSEVIIYSLASMYENSDNPERQFIEIIENIPEIYGGRSFYAEREKLLKEMVNMTTVIPAVTLLAKSWLDTGLSTYQDFQEKIRYIEHKFAIYEKWASDNYYDDYLKALKDQKTRIQKEYYLTSVGLPVTKTVNIYGAYPSLVAAYKAYGDPTKAQELECSSNSRTAWKIPELIPIN